ncbi:DUF305 domain-containing protein [Actinomycetospora corticicola]|uniref:Uncharacterized protein (DUF305 family) n=1 Tax=Actinomycetospora corticicola TaxID=663602 RepID=A0A7Y9J6Y8_9PSEU|nr:DUF305 domain-containing protein [Actinomycetospora corticicola]NYD36894.1 uncharacterized protein (DUF305 family) [Actinomycetospora corticicola]
MTASSVTSPPEPPDVDDGYDDDGGGWWSDSPGWAKGVLAVGLVLILLLAGGLVGALVGQRTTTTYGPAAGSVDVGFLQDMSVHHRQAIQMAVWERSNTTDPALRQMAFDIESSQTQQLGMMQGWLQLWDRPTETAPGQYMAWMGMPMTSMPGMASEADLQRFRSTTGRALDVEFLQLMLRHHRGGLSMMETAAAQASVSPVRALSSSMVTTQTAEAQTMTQMLAERGAAPLPMN